MPITFDYNDIDRLFSQVTSQGTIAYTYDKIGRQKTMTVTGQPVVNYDYDDGNRLKHVVQEKVSATPSANMLMGGLDQTFTRTDGLGSFNFLTDALGSTLSLTDQTGAEVTQYTYEPFGQKSVTGSASGNASQYTGRENDGTGLYYYRARYYSPTLQRFISEDPIGFAGGDFNLYSYVGNNPVDFSDPGGTQQRADRSSW